MIYFGCLNVNKPHRRYTMRKYIQDHLAKGLYRPAPLFDFANRYDSQRGWTDYLITDKIIFSHRKTEYTYETFEDAFHDHTFYEMSFCLRGNVALFCENRSVVMRENLLYLISPNKIHTGKLLKPSLYDRYVIYFDSNAFSFLQEAENLMSFAQDGEFFFLLRLNGVEQVLAYLSKIEQVLQQRLPYCHTIALTDLIQMLTVINQSIYSAAPQNPDIPDNILKIKAYIDDCFSSINTVTDIASHFFYSREYVSKLFHKYFNSSVYQYLMRKKTAYGIQLIEDGKSVTDACYQSGFQNMSSFIKYFTMATGVLPSKYKKSDSSAQR